jgi:segregation and condensation protein A
VADVADLLRACLVVLRVPEHADAYRPTLPKLWRVQDALARITRLLAAGVEGELGAFLPIVPPNGPAHDLRCRAAMASTLVAALELCRGGSLALEQPPGPQAIQVRRPPVEADVR